MSINQILSRAMNTTVTIARKTATKSSDTGEISNTSANVYVNVPATIQQLTSAVTFELEGIVEIQTHDGYINSTFNGSAVSVLRNDIVTNDQTSDSYRVISVMAMRTSRKSSTGNHHIWMTLERIV